LTNVFEEMDAQETATLYINTSFLGLPRAAEIFRPVDEVKIPAAIGIRLCRHGYGVI
jgi:hypothetical protein